MNHTKRTLALGLALAAMLATSRTTADGPNVLWITAEDMSPTLGCYGDDYAVTPNIDRLATEGVVYTNAFATSPVCSPSRACLINGLPATSQGTQQMRSAFPIPAYMKGFPSVLREAGYFTTNRVKTDYNTANAKQIVSASWDESSRSAHWRRRRAGQPFFAVFNLMTSHQSRSMVWPYEQFVSEVQSRLSGDEIHDPDKAIVPPYYPDTPVVRKTLARNYDCVTAMDKEVGAILQQLEEDGLAEDTIVFFYSDHGSGMPRHKRVLLDTGMQVALIVRFPKKYRHLAPSGPGTRTDRLVSFDDFGPTVLSLAGTEIPKYMEGMPFLGPAERPARSFVYGHRDRVDEVRDLARSVRDKRYLYLRNYMPHLGYNQPSAWPDQGEISHEFDALAESGQMTPAQRQFVGPSRPLEELYDCQVDPLNLDNLASSPQHARILRRMRAELERQLTDSRDLGFLPEALAWRLSQRSTLYQLARGQRAYQQSRLIRAASHVGNAPEATLLANLADPHPGVRYWGAVGLAAAKSVSQTAVDALIEALGDDDPTVRIESANALARHDHPKQSIPVLVGALEVENLTVVLHAIRTIELLGERAIDALPAVVACDARMKQILPAGNPPIVESPEQDMAQFVMFSSGAFLKRFDPGS